jgi:hypothetical protein
VPRAGTNINISDALEAGVRERQDVARAGFLCVWGRPFSNLNFALELRPLRGIPAPADARHLKVYILGPKFLTEARHGAAWATPRVPKP